MRKAFRKNWGPKIVSLVLATVIWMMINKYLEANGMWEVEEPLRAQPAPKDEQLRDLEVQLSQLQGQIGMLEKQRKILEEERIKAAQRAREAEKATPEKPTEEVETP